MADPIPLGPNPGPPHPFNRKFILAVFLILITMTALGFWRLSQLPAVAPPEPSPRAAATVVEERFAADLAKQGYPVRFEGETRVVIEVNAETWNELGREGRFKRHALVGDFRRALAAQQRDLGDVTAYRIEVREPQSAKLLAEETDFNLKVHP